MKASSFLLVAAVVLLGCGLAAASSNDDVAAKPLTPAVKKAGTGLVPVIPFESVDVNHDEQIDREEFKDYTTGKLPGVIVVQSSEDSELDETLNKLKAPVLGFWGAFLNSIAMIIVTELGDKTFFIAAILAMQHDRMVVFLGAVAALALMTVIGSAIGFALPTLLPRAYTHFAASILFAYFGFRLLKDAYDMDTTQPNEELEEVEQELGHDAKKGDVEAGDAPMMTPARWSILTKSFTLTFLAEWGDRSQIATIALASAKDPIGVTLGGVLGHAMCTGLAVIGGRMLATKISERTVAIAGGVLFVIFAIHSVWAGPDI